MQPPLRQSVEDVLAHLWMVRTFLKHADEFAEDPERLEIPRTVFDVVRAVETRIDADPAELLKMIRKKLPKLRAASEAFAAEAEQISNHTNFKMAVLSLQACVRSLETLAAVPGGESP